MCECVLVSWESLGGMVNVIMGGTSDPLHSILDCCHLFWVGQVACPTAEALSLHCRVIMLECRQGVFELTNAFDPAQQPTNLCWNSVRCCNKIGMCLQGTHHGDVSGYQSAEVEAGLAWGLELRFIAIHRHRDWLRGTPFPLSVLLLRCWLCRLQRPA